MFVSYHSFIVSHYRHLIFGLMLTFCSCLGQMFFISLFGEDFRQHLNLTYSELGWIYSMTTLMSGVFLLWLAPKIDSYKVSYFTFATLAILISAMLLISQVENLFIFFMVLFCLRFCSQAILSHIAMTSTARIFPLNRGKAIGIISVGFSLGEASLPLLMVTLSTYNFNCIAHFVIHCKKKQL